jgi:DNA polymerase I
LEVTSKPKPTLLIIDTHALAHRAFHAFPIDLSTKRGEHTNAIYGFASMLLQVLKMFRPDYIICAMDSKGPTFRHEMYDQYKATRPKTDELLVEQLPKITDLIKAAKIPTIAMPGYEADDIIGSIVNAERYHDYDKIIVTGDKDLLQVLQDDVRIFLAGSAFSKSVLYDHSNVINKLGFSHELLVDYKALRGDPSDNIPGVPGIGEKGATELVNTYHSIENIYDHLPELKPAMQKKLEQGKDLALLSKKLAQIETGLDIQIDLNNAEWRDLDFEELQNLFKYYEFYSLSTRLTQLTKGSEFTPGIIVGGANLTPPTFAKIKDIAFKKQELTGKEQILKVLGELKKISGQPVVYNSSVTGGIFAKPVRLNFAAGEIVYVIGLESLDAEVLKALGQLFSEPRITVYDGKKELHGLMNLGLHNIKFKNNLMLIDYILQGGAVRIDLQSSLIRYLNIKVDQVQQVSLFSEDQSYEQTGHILVLSDLLVSELAKYSVKEGWGLQRLYEDIEKPLTPILVLLERNGIRLDKDELNTFANELGELINKLQNEIYTLAGGEFNISSPKQLGEVLYQRLKIPVGKKTKGGAYSTNERALINYLKDYPIIEKILNFRELFKLKSTYTNTLAEQINPQTHRIHTTFNQAVVATGRLSSSDPNLQNIPTTTDLGQRIRKAFSADTGKLLVSFDYSQQELRLLAHLSNDPKLREAFVHGIDIHTATASQLFKIPVAKVTRSQRRIGKTVNFGVVYGISAFGLSDRLKIPNQEGQDFISTFYAGFPRVKVYFEELKAAARNRGYVESLYGRRRDASQLNSPNYQIRSGAEREIINFPLQGSAADIMKLAMIRTGEVLTERYSGFALMVLQVHDELIFEVRDDDPERLEQFKKEIKYIMANVVHLSVPMNVDVKAGRNWGELK